MKTLFQRIRDRKVLSVAGMAIAALLVGAPEAEAHTVTVGYVNGGPGAVTFWYGSYHRPYETPAYATEGTMTLVGINGNPFPATTVPFNEHAGIKPSGLLDGINNVYAASWGGNSSGVYRWQGVTFTDLEAGDYQFTYNPISRPTATWHPWDNAIRSSSVTVSRELLDGPPVADAGADVSVNEEQLVSLDGSLSSDPEGDALTFSWSQVAGTPVVLDDASLAQPSFTAPVVALGGESLTFELSVSANGKSSTDTVSINVVNVNHAPVADAGDDLSVAEGAPVVLYAGDSYDVDGDEIGYEWVQVSGPTMVLSDVYAVSPSFLAPYFDAAGAPGVVATCVFELRVTDSFIAGYVSDFMVVEITNVNNDPVADADTDQTANEMSLVALNGAGSSDPDGDTLTYSWTQLSGQSVTLDGDSTGTPSFTAPFVSSGGEQLVFELTVDDGYGGIALDTVVINVQNINDPPLASAALPSVACLWPPNHGLVAVGITGVSDPNDNATITIDSVTQDEETNGLGDGDTAVDAIVNGDGTVLLRAERSGKGDGRVYHIHFTASDYEGSASGVVTVCVPSSKKRAAVDGGELYDSTN